MKGCLDDGTCWDDERKADTVGSMSYLCSIGTSVPKSCRRPRKLLSPSFCLAYEITHRRYSDIDSSSTITPYLGVVAING